MADFINRLRAQPAFTVLELLVVMGVFAILLAIVLPTIGTVHTAALRKQAEAEATILAQAVIRYRTEYGFWPGQLVINTGSDTVRFHDHYPTDNGVLPIIASGPESMLNDMAFTLSDGATIEPLKLTTNEVYRAFSRVDVRQSTRRKTNPLNPKGIRFLDLKDEQDFDRVSFPDPWGNPYVLFMGMNPKSTFTHEVKNAGGSVIARISVSNTAAFAFSFGPNGKNSTNYIYSVGAR